MTDQIIFKRESQEIILLNVRPPPLHAHPQSSSTDRSVPVETPSSCGPTRGVCHCTLPCSTQSLCFLGKECQGQACAAHKKDLCKAPPLVEDSQSCSGCRPARTPALAASQQPASTSSIYFYIYCAHLPGQLCLSLPAAL